MDPKKLSEVLAWRGFVNQTTFKDVSALDGEPLTFYWGVDPSADSMQVGNLAAAMMVRHFIEHGHKAILLVGGATGLIGDPDGKAEERELKSLDEVATNKTKIVEQYRRIFAGQNFEIVDNYDWFKDMNFLQFLRDVGKHVPLRQMISRDFVQARLGEGGAGISYAEFSYSLIQGYDFLHLHREKGVNLQVCGADQWGNSIAGVELIRRTTGDEAHVWSTPLIINKTTGKKFGKSEAGAIWLDESKTSVYKFYQFWLNADDQGVEDYLKIFTMLSQEEIEKTMTEFNGNRGQRKAQKTLAYEVTKLIHGESRAESIKRVTEALFGGRSHDELSADDYELLARELKCVEIDERTEIASVLVEGGLASSNSDARRLLREGAIYVDGQRIPEGTRGGFVTQTNRVPYGVVRKGKNDQILVKIK